MPHSGRRKFSGWRRSARLTKGEIVAYPVLAALAALLWIDIEQERNEARESVSASFSAARETQSQAIAHDLQATFKQIYHGVRTVARLPAVRNLSDQSRTLTDDARTSAQELYNALAENVSISEIYIVSASFNPDAIDPRTGENEKPLATFDQLIVGRTAESGRRQALASHQVEEIEIFEYRAMVEHITWLRTNHPTEDSLSGLAYPALTSRPLITCDNTRFSPTAPDDEDRTGVVYSVPFYGEDGHLGGIVSAVVLKSVIVQLLRDDRHQLINVSAGYRIGAGIGRLEGDAAAGEAPFFLSEQTLALPGTSTTWLLWSGASTATLLHSPEMKALDQQFRLKLAVLAIVIGASAAAIRSLSHRHFAVQLRNEELTEAIEERTRALAQATRDAEQANAAKGEFLARVSHEIRTPLHAVINATELIELQPGSQALAGNLGVIRNASRGLLDLINQVLDLSAIEKGAARPVLQPFSLCTLLDDIRDLMLPLAQAKSLTLAVDDRNASAVDIVSDRGRVRQVLINLVGNAIKFTETGRIDVIAERLAGDGDGAPTTTYFSVSDTGCGIPAEARQRLFEPFRQACARGSPAQGSGLGLAVSRQIVEMLGGSIGVESAPGQGSRFHFTIPDAAPGGHDAELSTSAVEQPGRFDARVLLADDHPVMQKLIGELLKTLGCTVVLAGNGREAVHKTFSDQFDLVLMDTQMPILDGVSATREIRAREAAGGLPACKIIALSANAYSSDQTACILAGATDFLSKPFTRADLETLLSRHLNAPTGV